MSRLLVWAVCLNLIGLVVHAPVSAAEPTLAERLAPYVEKHQISGAVTLVANRAGVLDVQAIGQADLAGNVAMTEDALFGIASMTKPITATALMILVDEGKVALDDPVDKYLPAFAGVKLKDGTPPKTKPTLRHVLTHTSGLGGSQQNEGSLEQTVEKLAQRPLDFEPGTRWQYSPGLSVCGRVIEIVSGMPYDKFLSQRIFEPLGMRDTTFFPSDKQRGRIVKLYQPGREAGTIEPAEHWLLELGPDRTANPSGGLFSTAADLARFYRAILNGGELDGRRIVSAESVRAMTSLQTGDIVTGFTPGNGWGLGWCVVREPQGVSAMLHAGSHGHGGAFGTQGWLDPTQDLICVLLIQRTNFGNSDASDIRRDFQDWAVSRFAKR